MELSFIPPLNAFLNTCASLCLLTGFWAIKKQRVELHKKFMVTAFLFSTIFLGFYLYYHYFSGHRVFTGQGMIRYFYLSILFSHIVLAVTMIPMIFLTFYFAFKEKLNAHRKLARITLPIWLYVSITGVLIFFMLYVFFPG